MFNINKILVFYFIIILLIFLCSNIQVHSIENTEIFFDNFRKSMLNNNKYEIENMIGQKEVKEKIVNFLENVDILEFTIKIKNKLRLSNNKEKISIKYNIKYAAGINTISLTNINSYFILNTDEWVIEETNIINQLSTPDRIDWFIILLIIHFAIVIPFIIYITFFRFDLEQKTKSLWVFSALFFSIIGLMLFYFLRIKKRKN